MVLELSIMIFQQTVFNFKKYKFPAKNAQKTHRMQLDEHGRVQADIQYEREQVVGDEFCPLVFDEEFGVRVRQRGDANVVINSVHEVRSSGSGAYGQNCHRDC